MTKVTLADVANLIDATTAANTINSNSAATVAAIENTLSRDGTAPNKMEAPIDMDSNRIVNLPEPITLQEPLRLQDLEDFVGGSLTIESIPPGGTANQVLTKVTGTDFDVTWTNPGAVSGNSVTTVADITALKAVDTTTFQWANLVATGRVGQFAWRLGDFTNHIATDTNNGVYVKANAIAANVGAWVRVFDFQTYKSLWFGTVNDHATDNTTVINTIIPVANLVNTIPSPGRQSSAYIEIEGGVRFASDSLSFLPAGNWIFVYLLYFANSDTTKGVPAGNGGTNEHKMMSVNSGYPGDATGGMVAEFSFDSPLHPAIIVNNCKQVDGADAHFGTNQTRIPTSTLPARASYNIFDENVIRWRAIYENYAGTTNNSAVGLQPFSATISLANVGTTGWPTSPVAGTIVTGVTSGAKGWKSTVQVNPTVVLNLNWLSGTFIAGEKVTDGVTTSTNNITGGGVDFQNGTYPTLYFGTSDPVLSYGMFPNYALSAANIGGRLTLAPTHSSVATTLKETVTNASAVFTNNSAAVPTTGKQIVLASGNRLVTVPNLTNGTGSTATGLVGGVSGHGYFSNAGGVSSNAFNIASITHPGTGQYTVTFTNALANSDYSVSITKSSASDLNQTVTGITTSGFTINNFNATPALTNIAGILYFSVIGGQ